MLITIVSFLAVLLVLILVHEIGHFVTAKLAGVKVEEFGIFIKPRLLHFTYKGTIYSLNAIPIGGFVQLAGEVDPDALKKQEQQTGSDPPAEDKPPSPEGRGKREPGTLAGKSIPVRILVLGAGSLMNFLLPLVLLSIAFMLPHQEFVDETGVGDVVVEQVVANSPASGAGIVVGDFIVSLNGTALTNATQYVDIVGQNLGKSMSVVIRHADGTAVQVTMTPRENPPPGEGRTGLAIATVVNKSYPFWVAIPKGAVRYGDLISLFFGGIVGAVRGTVPFDVSGPVGIAQATGQVARMGMAALLQFAAFISLNLGIVNIFPLPALDGGRIAFVLLEWVRGGKRVSPHTEGLIHTIGFLLLMVLFLFLTYRDILRL